MKTIDEIQGELRELIHELDLLKEERLANDSETDWEHMSVDSARNPIEPHPLESFDKYTRKCYLTLLLNMARLDSEKLPESLSLIHRIAFGMRYLETHVDLREEFIAAQTLSYKQLDDIVQLFKNTDEKLILVLECMLLVGVFDRGKRDAIEYVAKLSEMLGLTKENLVLLSNMAAAILTQNPDSYKCSIRNERDIFDCYLSNLDLVFIVHADIPACYSTDPEKRFRRCDSIELMGNCLELDCVYCESFFCYGREITMEVPNNFILLANDRDIKPKYPIGAAAAHPLASMSVIRKIYGDAVNKYNEENKTNEN